MISLSPDVERLIAEQIRSGRYRSADDVVREGLELIQARERQAQPPTPCDAGTLSDVFDDAAKDVPPSEWARVPADLSKNVDRYLYNGHKTRS